MNCKQTHNYKANLKKTLEWNPQAQRKIRGQRILDVESLYTSDMKKIGERQTLLHKRIQMIKKSQHLVVFCYMVFSIIIVIHSIKHFLS